MISIVVPVYNREKVIIKTLESIKNQTFKDWECLVVDDKSADNSFGVVKEYAKSDKRFISLSNTRKKGAQGARNTGVLAAKGDFVVFFDSDDTMHSDFLEKVYGKVTCDNVDICGSFLTVLDLNDNKIDSITWRGYGFLHDDIVKGKTYFCNDSTIIRRQKLLDIGLLDEECPSYQEWETHLRLSSISSYTTVEEELVNYYRGGEDTISKSKSRAIRGNLYIFNKHRKEFALKYPLMFLNRTFVVFSMIANEKEEDREYDSLLNSFNNSVPFLYRIGVRFLFVLKTLLNRIKSVCDNTK